MASGTDEMADDNGKNDTRDKSLLPVVCGRVSSLLWPYGALDTCGLILFGEPQYPDMFLTADELW